MVWIGTCFVCVIFNCVCTKIKWKPSLWSPFDPLDETSKPQNSRCGTKIPCLTDVMFEH